jgi:hypothetical protein
MNKQVNGTNVYYQEKLQEQLKQVEYNQKILIENTRKLDEAKIYISVYEDKKLSECTASFFQHISSQDFELFLTPFTLRYISACQVEKDSFQVIFNEHFNPLQAREFLNRFTIYTLIKSESKQKKLIDELLNTISLDRLKAAVFSISHSQILEEDPLSDKNLLGRIQADSLIFPDLSNCKFSSGDSDTLKTIWKICIEDIDNFLEAFDTISQTPTNAMDAMQLIQMHQMSMALFSDIGRLNPFSNAGTQILGSIGLMFVPFIMNAARKLYVHYLTKTPSNLPPLYIYSDPNFYQGVAPVKNRDDILDQILTAWKQQLTPILIGESGCGKTSILIELARRIHQGVFPEFPQNEEYKVFGGTATSLASAGGLFGGNNHMNRIFDKISDKKDNTILLLDEIQGFDDAQKMLLRSRFDNNPNSVRYAVFATTTEGAKTFYEGDDGSLERRFIRIIVPKFTSEETQYILHNQSRSLASTLVIHPAVINRIVGHVNGEFAQSKKILFHVLRKALKKNQTLPSQEKYKRNMDALNLITTLHQRNILMGIHDSKLISQMIQLDKEKSKLEAHLQQEKLNIQNYDILIAKRNQILYKILDVSQEMLELFNDFLKSKGKNSGQIHPDEEAMYFENTDFKNQIENLTKKFIYYNYFLNPILCKKIKDFEEEHDLISEVTNEFITDDDLKVD